jgi:hypothetical protein
MPIHKERVIQVEVKVEVEITARKRREISKSVCISLPSL